MPEVNDWKGEPARVIETKLDGHNYILSNEGGGQFSALGRQVHIDNWAALRHHQWPIACLVERLPEKSCVMGELYVPGKPATKVPSGFLGTERLFFTAYAAPIWEGRAVPMKDLDVVRAELQALGFGVPVSVPMPFGLAKSEWEQMRDTLIMRARTNSVEGFVLKNSHLSGWYKVKPVKTADVVVMGWKGHLRDETKVGAFYIGAYVRGSQTLVAIGKVGSGLTKQDRDTLNGDECRGRVMEVEYQSVGDNGGLQFPVFLRWRDDKPAHECFIPEK